MPWAGRIQIDSNWPNEDSGWFMDVFSASIPDFDFDRFQEWIWSVEYTKDAQLLLAAPLCTASKPDPEPSSTCVLGDQIVHIEEKVVTPTEQLPATITFGSLPAIVAEASLLQPILEKTGLKPKKEQRVKTPSEVKGKKNFKTSPSKSGNKRLTTDPRTWKISVGPKFASQAEVDEFRNRMIVRWEKQEE